MSQRSLTASIPAILHGLAGEMDMLVTHGLALECSIAELATRDQLGGEMTENLQSLDMLLQHLSELRQFLGTVAEGAREEDSLSITRALDALKLHGLQCRLVEAIGGVSLSYVCAPAGEVDLF